MQVYHLWYRSSELKVPKRIDCGAMVGWADHFLEYLTKKRDALNANQTEGQYYIGDHAGITLVE